MCLVPFQVKASRSLPSRERGLKSVLLYLSDIAVYVAPLTGAWIEIAMAEEDAITEAVAPLPGAWIEIIFKPAVNLALFPSLPSRERGLKFKIHQTTRDLVNVAPLTGAWIEIRYRMDNQIWKRSRSPHGSVD